jgi:hypothetical protein
MAQKLEACRQAFRRQNNIKDVKFDGTRVIPNNKCRPLNHKMQKCLKWKNADESQCRDEITALKACIKEEEGIVAAPTEGDKIWSDYKRKDTNKASE